MDGITLSRRAQYAIRLCVLLAHRWPGSRAKARELADAAGTPLSSTAQILAQLAGSGVVISEAGPHGGYQLARAPAQVRLLDVVEAVIGALPPDRCVLWDGPCDPTDPCGMHDAWQGMRCAFLDMLADTDLASVTEVESRSPGVGTPTRR